MYYNGLGVEKDFERALSYFEQAADDFGEPSLPVIGDMHYFGQGVEKDTTQAINSYLSFNKYNIDKYIEYKELTPEQEKRALGLIEDLLSHNENRSYSNLNFISKALKYRIKNQDLLEKIEKIKHDLLMNTPFEDRNKAMEKDYVEIELNKLKSTLSSPKENTGFIPSELKVGDVFTFGKFNGEPLNWKVLEFNKDGSAYVITTDIIAKMSYDKVFKWLNEEFINYSFTLDEKKHIKPHGYSQFYKGGDTYLYLASSEQLEQFEGTYKSGTIKQTKFAKSLAKSSNVLCLYSDSIDSKGKSTRYMDSSSIEGIRPAMDVLVN